MNREEAERQVRRLAELMQSRDGGLGWPFATRELFRALRKVKNTPSLRIDRPFVKRPPNCIVCGEESEELGHVIAHDVGVYEWGIHPRWLQEHGTVPVCKTHNQEVEWDEGLVANTVQVLREAVEG